MNRIREKKEQEAAKAAGSRGRPALSRFLLNILNGSFLTREQVLRNMPFLLFLAFLMLMHIGYGYYTERTVRELHRMDAELKEQRSEHVSIRARLDSTEQQSRVAADIAGLGLSESRVPPVKIPVGRDMTVDQLER
jgi:hypothetical protein